MIYTSAIYADAAHTTVTGTDATDANGATETRKVSEPHEFRREGEFITGYLAEGKTIAGYVAPAVPLPDLAPYQFDAMLKLSGKKAVLDDFIAALPEPDQTVALSKLNKSLVFRRDNDLVMAAQSALNLTTAELDGLWLQAASII